jgi:hypothetical protein
MAQVHQQAVDEERMVFAQPTGVSVHGFTKVGGAQHVLATPNCAGKVTRGSVNAKATGQIHCSAVSAMGKGPLGQKASTVTAVLAVQPNKGEAID